MVCVETITQVPALFGNLLAIFVVLPLVAALETIAQAPALFGILLAVSMVMPPGGRYRNYFTSPGGKCRNHSTSTSVVWHLNY